MNDNFSAPSVTHIQKMQIEEWLRLADRHIKAGRYIAADELLQKVFNTDPSNELAESYQDRIQFFIKQLSQRVGMNVELQAEIRRYNDIVINRKSNQIQSYLVNGQKALEDGYFKKASDYTRKALVLDPGNSYAHALKHRIEELEQHAQRAKGNVESEQKFRVVLHETWRNGIPTESQINVLTKLQQQLKLSDGVRLTLERETRNTFYKNALLEIWNTGGISAFTLATVDELRKKFSISSIDHSIIESELLKEVRKNKIKGSVLLVNEQDNTLVEMAQQLRLHSFAVTAAGTIEEAVKTLKTHVPDIIISEVNFGGKPLGFELFEYIRSEQKTQHIPFFFTTEHLDRTTHIIGKRLGVDDFIVKPIDYELFFATLSGKVNQKAGAARSAPNRK